MDKTTQSVVRVSTAVFALCFLAVCVLHAFGVIQLPRFWSTPRGKATTIVSNPRIYEAAIDQWAIENNKINKDTFDFSDVSDYIRANTPRARTSELGSDKSETAAEPNVNKNTEAIP